MSTLTRLDSDLDLETAIMAKPEDDYEEFLTRCFHYSPKGADEPVSRKKNDLDVFKQRLSQRGLSMRDVFEKRMSRKLSADCDLDLCTTIDEVREVLRREEARTLSGITDHSDNDNHSETAKSIEQAAPLISVSIDNTVVEQFQPEEELVEVEPETLRTSLEAIHVEPASQLESVVALPQHPVSSNSSKPKGGATIARGITRSATTVVKEPPAPKLSSVGRQSSTGGRPPLVRANTSKAAHPPAPPAAVSGNNNKSPADIARAALLLSQKNNSKSINKVSSSTATNSNNQTAAARPAGPKRTTSSGVMGSESSSSGLKRSNSANKVTRPGLTAAHSKPSIKFNASEALAH
jgi:hypothetical protein